MPDLELSDYYVPVFNDGTLTSNEILTDFKKNNIALVVCLKRCNHIIVPIYKEMVHAKEFAKKNLKHKLHGLTTISKKFINYCNNNDITFRLWEYPKRITINLGYEIDCLTLEHDDDVEVVAIK